MLFGKNVNRYYIKYLPWLLLGVTALIVVDWLQLKVPAMYRLVVNGVNYGEVEYNGAKVPFDMDFLLENICLPMIFIILAMVLCRFLWRICFFGTGIKVETDLRSRMFDVCKDLSQEYYQHNKVGGMMSLFTNDLETVHDCFGSGVLMFADALFLGGMALFKMAGMSVPLTLLSMAPMLLLLCAGIILGKYMAQKWQKRQEAFSALSDFSQESFAGIAVIKAFVKEAKELSAFRKLNRDNEKANVEFTRLSVALNISVTLFVESVVCIILGYGGYLVWSKVFDAGQLIEFISYFTATVWPVMAVAQLIDMRSRGRASYDRISELLDSKPDVTDKEGVEDPGAIKGGIEFRHLTFRYPGTERDVLSDVSFEIKPGENVGIVGRTGAGKTTLVDLILRTYNVPDGTLFIDGHDVNSIPIGSVRRGAAYVPQDNFLFSDTIESNIAFASDSGDPELVARAAALSDVDGNIREFPDGYGTVLGERGVTVSGGQKQRISIARAIMKDAPILILDDSVSAVDVETEKHILENLKSIRAGKTTVLIAHRVSTIERMDKLIFLDGGRVVAVGAPARLYDECPEYRHMVDLQKLDELDSGKGGD
ncbi:MAG: ABC transporter ATP-binding protein [Clostridia bacterium]|nr:ABC transporter ATP-binding protein [Clostridia bacterium]